jgi:hypothetical protein
VVRLEIDPKVAKIVKRETQTQIVKRKTQNVKRKRIRDRKSQTQKHSQISLN